MADPPVVPPGHVVLSVKNPSKLNYNFEVTVPLDATVGELQQRIAALYEGNPPANEQTVGNTRGTRRSGVDLAFFESHLCTGVPEHPPHPRCSPLPKPDPQLRHPWRS